MKALVTGANGLIGANLVRELLARGIQVRGIVRTNSDLAALAGLDLELYRVDLAGDPGLIERAARGCTLVFHTAMHFTYDRRRGADLDDALLGTDNVLRGAHAAGVERVVVTSSSVVLGYSMDGTLRDESSPLADPDGENVYVDAKIRQHERALHLGGRLGIDIVIVCPTVSVGAHGSRLGPSNGLIVAYLADPFRLTFPGGCNIVSTADVASGHWLAAQHGTPGQHYILGSENLRWSDLHALVAELAGVEPPRAMLNCSLAFLAASLEETRARIHSRAPLSTREQAAMVGRYYWYRHARAEELGYAPRPARTALAAAVSWLAMSPHVNREMRTTMHLHDDVYAARRGHDGMPGNT